jgi:hypothetical protein
MNLPTPAPALGAATPGTPVGPVPAPLLDPVAIGCNASLELTTEQAITMANWLKEDVLAGRITPEVAEKSFAELGTSMSEQMRPDTRSDEVKQMDAAYPPGKPNDYLISYGDLPQSPELKQFDQSARSWLSAAEFDQSLGNTLVNTIGQVARSTQRMTPQELDRFAASEFEKLQSVYGKEELERKLNDAGLMVQEIERKHPGLKQLLKTKGLGDSSLISNMLIQQAERYWTRRKK